MYEVKLFVSFKFQKVPNIITKGVWREDPLKRASAFL
jgi:hypothetical protein